MTDEDLYSVARGRNWQEIAKTVECFADKKGNPIEKGIRETVTALLMLQFPTTGSCEGHETDSAPNAPYVVIYPGPHGLDDKALRAWRKRGSVAARRMFGLLEEFYLSKRSVPYDQHLYMCECDKDGWFTLISIGADFLKFLPRDKQAVRISSYKHEMRAFTEFLKIKLALI